MEHTYKTRQTCSSQITFRLDGDRVRDVHFRGGCDGNLKAVSKLVDGMTVAQIETLLRGNTCGPRPTSCADQLAIAVRQAYDEEHPAEYARGRRKGERRCILWRTERVRQGAGVGVPRRRGLDNR